MPDEVTVSGQLICNSADEVAVVCDHVSEHIDSTRAEPGCVAFTMTQQLDGHVWQVEERFADSAAFRAHQRRVAISEWGRVTAGIGRRYTIRGLEDG